MSDPANPPIRRPTYVGIGARRTPPKVLADMTRIARWLHRTGCHLNSGGADGADRAFADGATPDTRTLYLPWPGYNRHAGPDCRVLSPAERTACERLAAELHPAWERCSRGVRALHARNAAIVLGPGLDRPVHGVICWTPGGETVGGTGMAMRIADRAGVLVLNLALYSPRDVCVLLRNRYLYPPVEHRNSRAGFRNGEGE